jgi:DNA-binding transcriptional MerR regulator
MRISALSWQTGVPIATIKFYLREGLLPRGTPISRNQAEYGEQHLHRLRLIRAFTNVAQLDLSTVRELLAAIEDERVPIRDLYEVVNKALYPEQSAADDPDGVEGVRSDVDGLLQDLGWQIDPKGASRLAHVVATLRHLGCECDIGFFRPYADAAERLAVQELDLLKPTDTAAERAAAVARTVLLDVALATMRRLAQEHLVAQRYGEPTQQR